MSDIEKTDFEWGEDAVARLTELWGKGLSITQIGLEMGISRSAVVGKARRIKLPSRGSPIRPGGANPPRVDRKKPGPKPAPAIASALVDKAGRAGVHLSVLMASGCHWPLWNSRNSPLFMRYCGNPTEEGCSYCSEHAARMYGGREEPVEDDADGPEIEGTEEEEGADIAVEDSGSEVAA